MTMIFAIMKWPYFAKSINCVNEAMLLIWFTYIEFGILINVFFKSANNTEKSCFAELTMPTHLNQTA